MREIHNVKRDSPPQFPAPGLRPVSYLIYLPPHFIREYSEGPSIVPDTEDRLNNCFLNELINRLLLIYRTICTILQRAFPFSCVTWPPFHVGPRRCVSTNSLYSSVTPESAGLPEQGQAAHRLIPATYPALVPGRSL